jgi:hypothetical protein
MQGPVANDFWRLLLQEEKLHEELFQHALRIKSQSGILFDRFYEFLMERLLATFWRTESDRTARILEWHQRFAGHYFIRPGALNELMTVAKLSRINLEILRKIYRRGSCLPKQGIYDQIVPELCKLKEWKLALDWHFFLYSHRDFPQGSSFLQQAFRARPTLEEALAEFLSGKAGVHFQADALQGVQSNLLKAEPEVFNPATLSDIEDDEFKVAVDKMDAKPRHAPLSDEFCARLFATKGLSIPSIINYFQMFDHGKLGPLALRELMARAEDLDQATEYLQAFEDANIVTGASIYPRVIKHFIASQQFDLLENLVQSDLHPETLGDKTVQESLLKHYTMQTDQLSARRTIEILKMMGSASQRQGKHDPYQSWSIASKSGSQNEVGQRFASICHSRQPQNVQTILDDLLSQSIIISSKDLHQVNNCLRPVSVDGNSPSFEIEKDLEFVSNVMLRLLKSREAPHPGTFVQVLSRHGMQGDLHSVFRLFSFLVREHYTRPLQAQSSNLLGFQSQRLASPMEEISTYLTADNPDSHAARYRLHQTAGSIVSWGFRTSLHMLTSTEQYHSDPAQVYLNGLRFLSELSLQGFYPNIQIVASIVNRRLVHLFGTGTSKRAKNRWIKDNNYFTLEELLVAIEQVWIGPRLFPELYNNPGVPVVRDPRPQPRYFMSDSDKLNVSVNYSVPSKFIDGRFADSNQDDPWAHQRFHDLSARYGGSMLDGLLNETTHGEHVREETRIQQRRQLRYLFLGTEPPLLGVGGEKAMPQHAWDNFIRNSALEADRALVKAGLCPP